MARKIIGGLLIASPFIAFELFVALVYGWKPAIITTAATATTTVIIILGVRLLTK